MNLKKCFFIMFAIILFLSGCSQNENHNSNQTKNSENNNSTSYHRIISLMPSNTEILYELGLSKEIVGVSTVDDYPKNVKKGKEQFDSMNLNKESLLKAKPDLILAHESQKSSSGKVLNALKDSGVKVVYVKDAKSLQDTYDTFKQIGKITGREKQANQLIAETKENVKKVIDSVPDKHKKQNVFIEVSSKPDIYTAGSGTFFDDMIKQLGANNNFSNIKGWKSVNKEAIIKKNPDILISTEGISESDYKKLIKERGGFNKVNAVIHNRVESVDGDKISRPGPRIDEGLKELRDAIYQ